MKNIGEQAVSVEQILQTIRGVITGDNSKEDILELTEIVDDGNIDNQKSDIKIGKDSQLNKTVNEEAIIIKNELADQNIDKHKAGNNMQDTKSSVNDIGNNVEQTVNNKNYDTKALETSNKTAKNIMLSDEIVAEISETLKSLVRTVSKPVSAGLSFRNGTSLEDLIIEILKPYLKEWLDNNLPSIVKHIVEKEVQKLIPKDED
ncbi:MAG: DUF2497 domain-containing protein [Rickettsiales endosymbiont of Dermacentor nuttalli]